MLLPSLSHFLYTLIVLIPLPHTSTILSRIFARTFALSVLVTAVCVLISVPEAYVLSQLSARWRTVSILVVLGPSLVSVVVRTLGYAIPMGREGVINKALLAVGLFGQPIQLMY